jgi:TolB-like protein
VFRLTLPLVLLAVSAGAAPRRAPPKAAPDQPALAVHPIAFEKASRRGNEELVALFEKALVLEADVTPFSTVQEFVDKQSGGTCANRTPCLVALAKATGAKYALYASIAPNGAKLQLEARLVRASDGKVVKEVLKLTADKPGDWTREAAVEEAYRLLLAKLKLTTVPGIKKPKPPESDTPVATPEPTPPPKDPVTPAVPPKDSGKPAVVAKVETKATPPPVAPVEVARRPARPSSPMRTTGFIVGGVGVALGAGAAVMAVLANADAKTLTPDANGWVPSSQVDVALGMRTKATAALGMGIGAGVAVAAGAVMVVLGSGDNAFAVVPTSGGAMVVFSGALP